MIEKKGTSEKIIQMAKTSEEFEKIRQTISQENELIRCETCQHLIAKKSSKGYIDLQHRKESMIIKEPKEMSVRCPVCGNVTKIL